MFKCQINNRTDALTTDNTINLFFELYQPQEYYLADSGCYSTFLTK